MLRLSHILASQRGTYIVMQIYNEWEANSKNRKEVNENIYLKINYKYKKKCSSMILMMPIVFILIDIGHCSDNYEIGACSGDVQRDIFESMPPCLTRSTLIDLREQFSNNSEIVEVVPDHVTVERCGGSCYVNQYSCNPTSMSVMTIPVMLVLSKWPHGEHEILCSEVMLEVHHECQCGCKLEKHHCHPQLQYYHQPSCRYSLL